ncbi:MAG: nicotinate-nicotinamide nucleotide adenylyltransferase, partial [Anaerotignum sp.]
MKKKYNEVIYRELYVALTDKDFSRKMGVKKKTIVSFLDKKYWMSAIDAITNEKEVSCGAVLSYCEDMLSTLAKEVPKEGWLSYTYRFLIKGIYPHREDIVLDVFEHRAVYFYLEILRVFLACEREYVPLNMHRTFAFATEDEMQNSPYGVQYSKFLDCFNRQFVYELMRIGPEVTPFDTLAHVAGVHYIAMHVGRQLFCANVPVDLGLISGAAAGHDIGKYGCKDIESKRIPYLHYYYTDVWFQANGLSDIGHIAANHSTWDLELENLSVESLVLIYADFRVKTKAFEDGKEIMGVYSLEDSFHVILEKLDNLDQAKENRYRHVYSRLVDFENYMHSIGVNTDLTNATLGEVIHKETTLLDINETVEVFKNIAINRNIRLMHKLSREASFGDILEAARSARDWKNSRAYLDIFAEYFTYMNQKQKQMSISFLYELMVHREGDVRRQAGDLLGNMIANYDIEYGKELPMDVDIILDDTSGLEMWERYLEMIIIPDHKMIDRHRRWLGYGLKRVVISLLENCKEELARRYIASVLEYYRVIDWPDDTAFILIDTLPSVPQSLLRDEEKDILISFMQSYANRSSLEIRAAILLNLKEMAGDFSKNPTMVDKVTQIIDQIMIKGNVSLEFLLYMIGEAYGIQNKIRGVSFHRIFQDDQVVSDIFLENLKSATPWKIKIINIELLYVRISLGVAMPKLHVATHLSNLLKVSDQVTIRHFAGETLVKLAPLLSWDQRNEVAIELRKGLEVGEFEFSKYIPQYLGEYATYLHPKELNEFLIDIERLQSSTNDRIVSVALDTLGVIIGHYGKYGMRFPEYRAIYEERKKKIMGMILGGFASYHTNVNREAFWVLGHEVFGSADLNLEEKKDIFAFIGKKLITLMDEDETSELGFLNDTANWNAIYRFISDYLFSKGSFSFQEPKKVAFFPGSFDPFSLGHKEIAREIRNMGFIVYLAIDEFSWSKKTQPHRIRRRIINMSVANEENIYLFPENIPVNIANPDDLRRLRELFPDKEVYMVAGSDVVHNASSYKANVVEHSIQTFPHILFLRETNKSTSDDKKANYDSIQNEVLELKLPVHFEDVSSTRIRENIDQNRDISNLIDTVAQNYIYENSLYLREPQYKQLLVTKAVEVARYTSVEEVEGLLFGSNIHSEVVRVILEAMYHPGSEMTVIFDKFGRGKPDGIMVYRHLATTELYKEFEDIDTANYIRENTSGKIVLFEACFTDQNSKIVGLEQFLFTESIARALEEDYTYGIFSLKQSEVMPKIQDTLIRQGFLKLTENVNRDIYVVDMKSPITLYHNAQTEIKEPFNSNEQVLKTLRQAHHNMQMALTKLYPGSLVISFDAGMMHNRLIELITKANNVPKEPTPVRNLGPNMCVPFGKILKGIVIPNTVTKVLHTEKVFDRAVKSFKIKEFPQYLPLDCQVRMINSFRRPVILVDDLLHKGYRIRELDRLFKDEGVKIDRIVVGVLSGRGRDLMEIQGREVESAYFLPSLKTWFVETSLYPFIGGDGLDQIRNKNNGMI